MKYPYNVVKTKEGSDIYWVAKSDSLKGCIGVGETSDEAVKELEENETAWLEAAEVMNMTIPDVPIEEENNYSGKFSLRISPAIHRKAAVAAKREGISLNQLINDAITTYITEISTADYISDYVAVTAQNIGKRSLSGSSISKQESKIIGYLPKIRQDRWSDRLVKA